MSLKPIAMRDAFLERIWEAMKKDKKIFFSCADFENLLAFNEDPAHSK